MGHRPDWGPSFRVARRPLGQQAGTEPDVERVWCVRKAVSTLSSRAQN